MPYAWLIYFLVLWSIYVSSSLLHFRKVLEYLTWRTAQVFIPLIRFRLNSFISSSFLVLLRYSFWICSFISTYLMGSASKMPKYLYICFCPSVLIWSWFGSSIPSVICRLPLFITSMAHFSMPNSIPMSWLYILTACLRVSSSFSFFFFFAKCLMLSMYIRWLIFSCYLLSFYSAVHFLSMWLSGFMAIMNSKGHSPSHWKIPISAKLLPPAVSSTLHVFMFFFDNIYDVMRYFVQFEAVYYPALWNHVICLFVVNPCHS